MNIRSTLRRFLAVVLLVAVAAGPVLAQETSDAPRETIVEVAQNTDNYSTLVQALKAAGLVGALQGEGPFTVFAPTNDAFAKLPDGQLEALLKEENKSQLETLLTYHVVPTKAPASAVTGLSEVQTLQGKMVQVQADDGVTLTGQNSATVTSTDIMASNGVIHVIDTVLLPPEDGEMKKSSK